MLSTRVRDSPCRARCLASSEGRVTVTAPSCTASAMSGWKVRASSPLGPLMVSSRPATAALTPPGSGTGFLPIRDTDFLLPDQGDELAAHVSRARVAVGHQALGRADDRHAESVLDPRDGARADVAAQAGRRDALEL